MEEEETRHETCIPGASLGRHIRAAPQLCCTPAIWHNAFDFRSVSILGNSLQTVSHRAHSITSLQCKSPGDQSGTAESGLVKDEIASARAGGLGTDSRGRAGMQGPGRDVPPLGP